MSLPLQAVQDAATDQNFRQIGQTYPLQFPNVANVYGPVINAKSYGARGDGRDDTEAVQLAGAALGANGGTIFFPYGVYSLSGQLDFDGTHSVRLAGASGLSSGAATGTKLEFTQEGSESAISARSTSGFTIADLGIFHSASEFTGALLDLTHNGEGGSDSAYSFVERCGFFGGGSHKSMGVNLDKAIACGFRGCVFEGLDIAARGQASKGRYSNSMRFDACTFTNMKTIPLKNAGDSWYVTACTFDSPLLSGGAGAYTQDAELIARQTTFEGCWMGDVTTETESTWIDWNGFGLNVHGNLMGGNKKVSGIKVSEATSIGVSATCNRFDSTLTGITLAEGVKNYIIGANNFSTVSGKKVSVDGGATDKGEGFLSN